VGIVQQASGLWTGTSFTPTLPVASSAANGILIIVAGNTTVTTPTNWTLRTSQVNTMGHYAFTRDGVALTSVAMTSAAGQGTWYIAEIAGGVYQTSTSQNANTNSTTYSTLTMTPTAGTRELFASIGSTVTGGAARTVSGWTNSFVEQADLCQATVDGPMQGVASLDNVAANGSTAYTTTATYSAQSTGRSAIAVSYVTTDVAGIAFPFGLLTTTPNYSP
jgi:hypothetical protein